jgi:hypothetical protein
MALLSKLEILSYPELVALTDQEEKLLLEELKINLLQLALTNNTVKTALQNSLAPTVKEIRAAAKRAK